MQLECCALCKRHTLMLPMLLTELELMFLQALVLGRGSCVSATTESKGGMRFLLIAGKPIGEPIVQYGPFVMNTQKQIEEAFRDHQRGLLQNPTDDVWAAA